MKKIAILAFGIFATQYCFIQPAFCNESNNSLDKSIYNIFNPTPKEKMRDFDTDRPDKIESPHTVDAGHFQIETDIITFSQNKEEKNSSNDYGFNVMNLKVGLTNNIDFQVVLESYLLSNSELAGKLDSKSGFGDTTARLKINLFGNDKENAIAIMPFLKIPTNTFNSSKYFEGGLMLPAEFELPLDFSMGAMLVWNYSRNDETNSYNNTFVSSLSIGRDIIEKLSGYVELYSDKNLHNSNWVVTLDGGIAYPITENIKLDCGVNWGLTKEADDINPFIGISARL